MNTPLLITIATDMYFYEEGVYDLLMERASTVIPFEIDQIYRTRYFDIDKIDVLVGNGRIKRRYEEVAPTSAPFPEARAAAIEKDVPYISLVEDEDAETLVPRDPHLIVDEIIAAINEIERKNTTPAKV